VEQRLEVGIGAFAHRAHARLDDFPRHRRAPVSARVDRETRVQPRFERVRREQTPAERVDRLHVQVIEGVETFQNLASDALDTYLSTVGNRTNTVMKASRSQAKLPPASLAVPMRRSATGR